MFSEIMADTILQIMFNGGTGIWMFLMNAYTILTNIAIFVYSIMGSGSFPAPF